MSQKSNAKTPKSNAKTPKSNAKKVTPCKTDLAKVAEPLAKVAEKRTRKKIYMCENCNYSTKIISNYKKHILSKKHLKKVPQKEHAKNTQWFKSNPNELSNMRIKLDEYEKILEEKRRDKDRIAELEKKNMEIEIKYLKQTVDILESTKPATINSHNTTNSHTTNNISINMYINDHCQDAMNLDDFVNKIKFKLQDVFDGTFPIQNSVQKLFIKNLNELGPTQRPVHCTDMRRGKFLVNDKNDGWVKDDGEKIAQGVKKVQHKAIIDAYDAFDKQFKPPHPGKLQDKKDAIVNPLRSNIKKDTPKIIKELANVTNVKDAINQLDKS